MQEIHELTTRNITSLDTFKVTQPCFSTVLYLMLPIYLLNTSIEF